MVKHFCYSIASLLLLGSCSTGGTDLSGESPVTTITHGPILGHITDNSVRIWARTSQPASLEIEAVEMEEGAQIVNWLSNPQVFTLSTSLENDNTGSVELQGLNSDTKYAFHLLLGQQEIEGSFRTLPKAEDYRDNTYNPQGLFNFQFEFGSCASQNPKNGIGYSLPVYTTMLEQLKDQVHFAIMNGDWLYEEKRDYPVASWMRQLGLDESNLPKSVQVAPTIVGVWENYKTYMSRGQNLMDWHRQVPSYFTFDDHELINDIWGAGSTGHRDRRAVFRDIGVAAWFDYLGWADPIAFEQEVTFGKAELQQGSDILHDPSQDFTQLDWEQAANLHVHWGTATAGVDDIKLDVDSAGDPNSRVYAIEEVIDQNRLRLDPPAVADGSVSYSIGRKSYSKFTVSNCDFFLLDTKTFREYHDTRNRDKPGLSILGQDQREWLIESMQNSPADFFFVVSTVPFMIPHIGAGGYAMANNKDESWTVFIDEREKLIEFWESLDKPVFVLTGDLHNSFAIKITDQVWEFCSGPHNSVNHRLSDEGDRPYNGLYHFDQREMDIRWSSFILDDIPRPERLHPYYCVVQVNNVVNNPLKIGEERWVAFPHPQVIFKYYDGRTGELRYAESVSTKRKSTTIYQEQ